MTCSDIVMTTQPAFVSTNKQERHHDYHHGHHGISDKDDAMILKGQEDDDRNHKFNNTDRTLSDIAMAIERRGAAAEVAIEKVGAACQLATEKTAAASLLAITDAKYANLVEAAKNTAAIELSVEKTAAAAIAATNQSRYDNLIEASKNAAAAALATEKVRFDLLLDSQKNTSAITLGQTTGFNAQAMQLAECCCELKSLIRETDTNRLRDDQRATEAKLVEIQTQLLILSGGILGKKSA